MIFNIRSPKKVEQEVTFAFNINGNEDAAYVLQHFHDIWEWLTFNRNKYKPVFGSKPESYYQGLTKHDADSLSGLATTINCENLFRILIRLNNAHVPYEIGRVWLDKVFHTATFCLAQIPTDIAGDESKLVKPLLIDRHGIFALNFYTLDEWARFSASTIANTGSLISYDYCDFSQVANTIYIRRTNPFTRPMIWTNPILLESFIQYGQRGTQEAIISLPNLQIALSNYIICAIYDRRGKTRESVVKEVWDVAQKFSEKKLDTSSFTAVAINAEAFLEAGRQGS